MVKTHLEFRSNVPLYRGTNERTGGRELIELLAERLPQTGIAVSSPTEEDWGWSLYATADEVHVLVGCGPYQEYDDGWLSFVEPPKGILSWVKRGPIAAASAKVSAAMRDVIADDGRFRDLAWWTDADGVGPTAPADGT